MTDGRHQSGGLFIGILVTAIGVIFLLDQMEIIHASYILQVFWPLILIALGVGLLLRARDSRRTATPNTSDVPRDLPHARRMTSLGGPLLILIGVASLLGNLTHIRVALGPLVLILIGAWLILKRTHYDDIWRGQRHGAATREWWQHHGRYKDGTPPPTYPPPPGAGTGPNPTSAGFAGQETASHEYWANEHGQWGAGPQPPPNAPPPPGAPGSAPFVGYTPGPDSVDDTFERSVIFMSFNRRIMSRHFRYGKISAIFGGFHIDFTGADIEGNQAVVQIEAIFGGGEIRIPPTWRVSVTAHEIAGAIVDETYSRPDAAAPAKVLVIHGTTVFGGVVIKN